MVVISFGDSTLQMLYDNQTPVWLWPALHETGWRKQ